MTALFVFALVVGTTGMAVGASEAPAQEPVTTALVSAAVEEPEAEPVAVVEETAEAAEAEPIPLDLAPAAPAAPAKAAAASEAKPATQSKSAKPQQQQQAPAASVQSQPAVDGESAAGDSTPQAVVVPDVVEPGVAALRWAVTTAEGVNQTDTSFEIQGPGGTDVNDDAQWTTGLAATVKDFTGQENYSGLDLDPAAGVFEVAQLVSDDDSAVTEQIEADQAYRVRPTEAPEGIAVGNDADWQPSTGAVDPKSEIDSYLLTTTISQEVTGGQDGTGDESDLGLQPGPQSLQAAPPEFGTLAAGPDGAAAPYLYWSVKDQDGNPAGGTSFRVSHLVSSRLGAWTWSGDANSRVVEDCVSAPKPCPAGSLDKDPDPGEFLITQYQESQTGGNTVVFGNNYRIRPNGVPVGTTWTSATGWKTINGTNNNTAAWSNSAGQTHNFGAFNVKSPTLLTPTCAAGYVYSIAGNGQMRQVSPNNVVTAFGAPGASGEFNGLGIGADGSQIYSFTRSDQTATIQKYDVSTGQWTSTGKSVTTGSGQNISAWVAGGVDLSTGDYYFGGFGTKVISWSNWTVFHIWKYNPGTNTISYSGYARVINSTSGTSNGDLAFNSSGDMLVVRGSGTSVRIVSINAVSLASANGGELAAASSVDKSGVSSSVNGIAFDAAGKGFLGNGTTVTQYNMPGWQNGVSKTTSLSDSTDLAGCSSPATIALYKNVNGERVRITDQFKLNLNTVPASTLETVTTQGTDTGVQSQNIGPLPTARGTKFTFNEQFVGSGNASADYVSKWVCTIDGQLLSRSDTTTGATGTSGTVTIPATGDAVVCTITNAPLVANVTVHKEINTVANPSVWTPKSGWPVGVAVTSFDNPTVTPQDPTQNTGPTGDASWKIRFADQNHSANLSISEGTDTPGYEFESGVCTVWDLNGALTSTVEIEDPASTPIPGVKAGDKVDCTFRNKEVPVSIVVKKQWVVNGGNPIAHDEQDVSLGATLKLDDVETPWGSVIGSRSVGETINVSEQSTIETEQCTLTASTISGPGLTGEVSIKDAPVDVELELGENAYMVTNSLDCVQELTLTKVVDNSFEGTLLPDDWSLAPADWNQKLVATSGGTEYKFDSGETINVPEGTFTLSELDQPGYQFVSLVCGDETITDSTIEIGFAQAIECTFTNKIAPGSVIWQKVDAAVPANLLGQSEWSLTGPDGTEFLSGPIIDCVEATSGECSGPDQNHQAGKFALSGLPWGVYTLTETKAPPGYVLPIQNSRDFIIGPDNIGENIRMHWDFDKIVNEQQEGMSLPLTGGLGTQIFILIGGSALAASLGITAMRRRKGATETV
ncbi:SpaA isopeptide-forming pilin-related protein [Jonesiaceae bacterium BS-20]|uniref:SpaA isopeptide-forming pilin-related protein n=1 Tax=Jonesiaceae bacterium BS-20 TaxID=3120821 RepID=A0AAU7DWG0_9MICO